MATRTVEALMRTAAAAEQELPITLRCAGAAAILVWLVKFGARITAEFRALHRVLTLVR